MKKNKVFMLFMLIIICVFFISCSSTSCLRGVPSCIEIIPPTIRLTGEKTTVERQIVGEYKELESDAWNVSSVKTNIPADQKSLSQGNDKELYEALKICEFHKEKIRNYKDQEVVGEDYYGYVQYLNIFSRSYENKKDEKLELIKVIKEENKARKIIFTRTLVLAGVTKPSATQIKELGIAFAKEQKAKAKKNDLIMNNKGQWERK